LRDPAFHNVSLLFRETGRGDDDPLPALNFTGYRLLPVDR
jgi:hypothetical protein